MKTEDKLTLWARPGILWIGMLSMLVTDIIAPIASKVLKLDLPKLTLDANFWDAWSLAVSIYVGGRTLEKIGLPKKFGGQDVPDDKSTDTPQKKDS